jgi:SAM-dependent methyltransferase
VDEPVYEDLYRSEDSHWWFRGRRAVIRALMSRAQIAADPRLLDAGCGTGRNLVEFGTPGRASGVDISAQAVEFCRRRGLDTVSRSPLEDLPFGPGEFDLILNIDVIEHVDDDVAVLRELRRVAAPGATLILTTPAYNWLWSAHDESHHHRRRYLRRQIEERAAKAGWKPAFGTYFNSILLPPIALLRRLRRNRDAGARLDTEATPEVLNPVLELPMRFEAGLIRRGLRLPAGVSIGLVCVAGEEPVPAATPRPAGSIAR